MIPPPAFLPVPSEFPQGLTLADAFGIAAILIIAGVAVYGAVCVIVDFVRFIIFMWRALDEEF